MNALLAAIMTKLSGSSLATYVGNRIYLDEAPEQAVYPNVVFMIVTSSPRDTFTDRLEETLIQFSLRSTSESATEITTMYGYLTTLFDYATLTISGKTNVQTQRESLATMLDEITTPTGTIGCRHWAVDYSIMVKS